MNSIEKFQEEVRKNQKVMKKKLDECEAEINSMKFLFGKPQTQNLYKDKSVYLGCTSNGLSITLPNFKKYIDQNQSRENLSFEKHTNFEECVSLIPGSPVVYSKNAYESSYTADMIYKMIPNYERNIENYKSNYLAIQNIMACFDKDRIKSPVHNIINLLLILQTTTLLIEEKSKVIGAVIYFNNKYIERNGEDDICFFAEIQILANYYNPDGSFAYNTDIETFRHQLTKIKNAYEEAENLVFFESSQFAKHGEPLINIEEMVNLLIRSNKNHKEKITDNNIANDENTKNEARKELEKYLVNGKVLELPSNLNKFMALLERCSFADNELSEIKSNVKKEILRINNLSIVPYLSKEEKLIFNNAWTLLQVPQESGIICNSIKEIFESLELIAKMLEEAESEDEKEYLYNEIAELIKKLEMIINKRNVSNEKANNNLIFIKGASELPLIIDDINELGENYHKIVSFLIRKINKDNKNSFVRQPVNSEFKYPVYELANSKAHVMFVEIIEGVYIIVGAAGFGMGYEKLINRILTLEPYFELLSEAIIQEENKNAILEGNRSFMSFFSDNILKRKKDK